jgi:proteasome accessory factor B
VGAGYGLRRQARSVEAFDDSWSLVTADFTDTEAFAQEIASFGPDVVVESPADLRDCVIRRLTGALGTTRLVGEPNR